MDQPAEKKMLWGLPVWMAIAVFAVACLAGAFRVVAMRELLGWAVPEWVGGAVGGFCGVVAVQMVAARRRVASGLGAADQHYFAISLIGTQARAALGRETVTARGP